MPRLVSLAAGLGWLTLAASACAPGCALRGTCHEPLGRCDCPKGFTGADCSTPAFPGCSLPEGLDTGCLGVSTCTCLQQCEQAGALPARRGMAALCLDGNATTLAATFALPLRLYEPLATPDGVALPPKARRKRALLPTVLYAPLADCPGSCSQHGLCERSVRAKGVLGPSRCVCAEGWGGRGGDCSKAEPELVCPGACSGRGVCTDRGWCHCQPGSYGADCSLSGATVPRLAWPTPSTLRPRIYVYDLPPRFNAWWRTVHGQRWQRNLGSRLHERLLASRYRTDDPREADFFYVPVAPLDDVSHDVAIAAARWVAATHPWWNASQGRDHVYAFAWDYGACWVGGHPLLRRSVFLSHFGLETRATAYFCDCPLCAPAFARGKDVVVPDTFELPHKVKALAAAAAPHHRPTRLFFSGRVTGPARRALFAANLTGPGVRIVKGVEDLAAEMAASVFCLSAPGAGFGSRAVLAIAAGCIPVAFVDDVAEPFEDVLDWEEFGVRVPEASLNALVARLEALPPAVVAAKQAALRCVAPRFLWSSIDGRLGTEDGSGDAFEVLMHALRRLRGGAPQARLRCADGVPQAAPLLRPVCALHACDEGRPWPAGGAACGGGTERPC